MYFLSETPCAFSLFACRIVKSCWIFVNINGIIGYLLFHYSWLKSVTVIIPWSQIYFSEGGLNTPFKNGIISLLQQENFIVLLTHYANIPLHRPRLLTAWLTSDPVKACSRFHIVLTTDFLGLFTSWNTITYLIYRAKMSRTKTRTPDARGHQAKLRWHFMYEGLTCNDWCGEGRGGEVSHKEQIYCHFLKEYSGKKVLKVIWILNLRSVVQCSNYKCERAFEHNDRAFRGSRKIQSNLDW